MARTAINAPPSVLKNYDFTYEPPRVIKNIAAFTTEEHGRVYEGLNILANGTGIVLNHRTIFRDCRIRFVRTAAVTGVAAAAGSEFENCLIEYLTIPAVRNSLTTGWVGLKLTNVPHVRLQNVTFKGGTAGMDLSGCENFRGEQIRHTDVLNNVGGSMGFMLSALNCANLELRNFANINALNASYTSDLIKLNGCDGAHLINGVLDGNNAPTGSGIRISNSSSVLLEDIDAVRMSDSAVDIDSGIGTHLRRVRVKDNNGIGTGGRAAPTGGGYAFRNAGLHTTIERCVVHNLYTPANVIDLTGGSIQHQDIRTEAFTVGA